VNSQSFFFSFFFASPTLSERHAFAASSTSSIGIERMFHTAEHLAKMDEFLEKVKQLDPRFLKRFPDLPVLVFERALGDGGWGAKHRARKPT
jgi:hypothetical protein